MQFLFDNRFGILSILILFGAFNGYLITLVFLINKRGRELANRIFAVIIVIFALRLTEMGLVVYGQIWKFPYLSNLTFPLLFLIGPLYYLYTKRFLNPNFRLRWQHLWMSIPAIAHLVQMLPWFLLDSDVKSRVLREYPIWELPEIQTKAYVFLALIILHTSIYLLLSYKMLKKYNSAIENQVSDNRLIIRLRWLRTLTFFLCAYVGGFLVLYVLLLKFGQYGTVLDRAWLLLLSAFVHVVGYFAIQQPVHLGAEETPPASNTEAVRELRQSNEKYKKSALSLSQARAHLTSLSNYMDEGKPYLKEDLRVSEIASVLGIPTYHLSQALTQASEYNFFDFVNQYRVAESKRLLLDSGHQHLTVLAIAHEAGFNNKASFNRAFKKFTGLTPSAYRRDAAPTI